MRCAISWALHASGHVVELFDVKLLVEKTIEFVHAFLKNFEAGKEVLKESTRVVVVIVFAY